MQMQQTKPEARRMARMEEILQEQANRPVLSPASPDVATEDDLLQQIFETLHINDAESSGAMRRYLADPD
jgi:hypothetical protein